MKLTDLKKAVDEAIEYAIECNESPETIEVSLQIEGPETQTVWSSDEVGIYYDNNLCAAGCVLKGWISGSELNRRAGT